jgi:hypothetical protein
MGRFRHHQIMGHQRQVGLAASDAAGAEVKGFFGECERSRLR